MKRSTKTLMLLCVIVAFILCVAGFVACGNDGNEKKGTLTLDATKKDMTVGTTATITATLQDSEDEITWSSNATSIATVSGNGTSATITAVAAGEAVITASAGDLSDSCTITVTDTRELVLQLGSTSAELLLADPLNSTQIVATVQWDGKDVEASLSYESDNTAVATVSDTGVVTGVGVGTASITVTATYIDKQAVATFIVNVKNYVQLNVVSDKETLLSGETAQISYSLTINEEPAAEGQVPEISINNNSAGNPMAKVEKTATGWTLTAIRPGTITVNLTYDGQGASCNILSSVKGTVEYEGSDNPIKFDRSKDEFIEGDYQNVLDIQSGTVSGVETLDGTELNLEAITGETAFKIDVTEEIPSGITPLVFIVTGTDGQEYAVGYEVLCVTKTLMTKEDIQNLKSLSKAENDDSDTYGGWFELGADIDMDYEMLPQITGNTSDPNKGFIGVIDGRGFAIKNVSVEDIAGASLFGTLGTSGQVKDLMVSGLKIPENAESGLFNTVYGTVEGVLVSAEILGSTATNHVSPIADALYGTVKDSVVSIFVKDDIVGQVAFAAVTAYDGAVVSNVLGWQSKGTAVVISTKSGTVTDTGNVSFGKTYETYYDAVNASATEEVKAFFYQDRAINFEKDLKNVGNATVTADASAGGRNGVIKIEAGAGGADGNRFTFNSLSLPHAYRYLIMDIYTEDVKQMVFWFGSYTNYFGFKDADGTILGNDVRTWWIHTYDESGNVVSVRNDSNPQAQMYAENWYTIVIRYAEGTQHSTSGTLRADFAPYEGTLYIDNIRLANEFTLGAVTTEKGGSSSIGETDQINVQALTGSPFQNKIDGTGYTEINNNTKLEAVSGEVTYSSSNDTIASIDDSGVLTAKAEGTTIIAVTFYSEYGNTITTYYSYQVVLPRIELNTAEAELNLLGTDAQKTLQLVVERIGMIEGEVEWTSSLPEVASVDENGFVKALSAGETTITAQVGSYSATCEVEVVIPDTVGYDATGVKGYFEEETILLKGSYANIMTAYPGATIDKVVMGETDLNVDTSEGDNQFTIDITAHKDLFVSGMNTLSFHLTVGGETKIVNYEILMVTKIIDSSEELLNLAETAKEQSEGATTWSGYYELGADIDLNGAALSLGMIGTGAADGFIGTIDGRGYAIKDILNTSEGSVFGTLGQTGVIKNLMISDYQFYSSAIGLFDKVYGTIEGIYISSDIRKGSAEAKVSPITQELYGTLKDSVIIVALQNGNENNVAFVAASAFDGAVISNVLTRNSKDGNALAVVGTETGTVTKSDIVQSTFRFPNFVRNVDTYATDYVRSFFHKIKVSTFSEDMNIPVANDNDLEVSYDASAGGRDGLTKLTVSTRGGWYNRTYFTSNADPAAYEYIMIDMYVENVSRMGFWAGQYTMYFGFQNEEGTSMGSDTRSWWIHAYAMDGTQASQGVNSDTPAKLSEGTWYTLVFRPTEAITHSNTSSFNIGFNFEAKEENAAVYFGEIRYVNDFELAAVSAETNELAVGGATTLTVEKTLGTLFDNSITITKSAVEGEVTYTSSNNEVIEVDNTGKVTAISAGTASITVSYISDNGNMIQGTYTITVS